MTARALPVIVLTISELSALPEYSRSIPTFAGPDSIGRTWRGLGRDGRWHLGRWEVDRFDPRYALARRYRPIVVPDGAVVQQLVRHEGCVWVGSAGRTAIATTDPDWMARVLWREAAACFFGWEAA